MHCTITVIIMHSGSARPLGRSCSSSGVGDESWQAVTTVCNSKHSRCIANCNSLFRRPSLSRRQNRRRLPRQRLRSQARRGQRRRRPRRLRSWRQWPTPTRCPRLLKQRRPLPPSLLAGSVPAAAHHASWPSSPPARCALPAHRPVLTKAYAELRSCAACLPMAPLRVCILRWGGQPGFRSWRRHDLQIACRFSLSVDVALLARSAELATRSSLLSHVRPQLSPHVASSACCQRRSFHSQTGTWVPLSTGRARISCGQGPTQRRRRVGAAAGCSAGVSRRAAGALAAGRRCGAPVHTARAAPRCKPCSSAACTGSQVPFVGGQAATVRRSCIHAVRLGSAWQPV